MFAETLRETLKQRLRQTIQIAGVLVVMFSLPLEARTYKIATVAPDGLGWIKDLRQAFKTIDAQTEGRVRRETRAPFVQVFEHDLTARPCRGFPRADECAIARL